ncbi:MAG: hypothetical protein AAGE52_22880 [Myxococcota bacterium]
MPDRSLPTQLPLADPRWRDLSAYWRDGASKVPRLLEMLCAEPSFEHPRDSVWAELHEIIYHQYCCYESAYAAVPYLVELGLVHPADRSAELWISVGHMAATYAVCGDEIPEYLAPAFHAAIEVAEARCLEVLLSEPWDGTESRYLALAALGLSGHRVGFLIATNLVLADAEGGSVCPACTASFLFALRDDGIVTYTSLHEPYPQAADDSQPRRVSPLTCTGDEHETPWRRVAECLANNGDRSAPGCEQVPGSFIAEWQPEFDAAELQCRVGVRDGDDRSVVCVIGALLALKGERESASRFLRLAGGVRCPECNDEYDLFDSIADLRRPLSGET